MSSLTVRGALTVGALSLSMVGGAAVAAQSEPTEAVPTGPNMAPGAKDNFDPVYNVCRGTDPRCYNPWVDDRQERVLIYSRTAGPRHANLGTALAAGLNPPLGANNVAQNALIKWMAEQGVTADWTEDVTRLSSLNKYKAVIFMSPTRDTLWKHGTAVDPTQAVNTRTNAQLDAAKTALRQYIRAGGGFVGIHNAFGTEYNWPWYEGLLGNANYYDHGANQNGVSVVVGQDSSTAGLPARWEYKDEWYNLVPFPSKVKFLLTVDENTLATRRTTHPGHGDFHPTTWCQYYDGGRSWVTTLGHDGQAFIDGSGFPGQVEFKSLIVNGILSAMGNKPFCGSK
ncbi:MAG: ThuA domain-containing protein [Rubrivivax sp.]